MHHANPKTATPPRETPTKSESTPATSTSGKTNGSTPVEPDHNDIHVSDLDSDLDADELIPAYLKVKSKLYEIDPQLVESTAKKPKKNAKSKTPAPALTKTPAVRKLLSQLQQLTSDTLFDEDQAEAQWPARRNQIAQNQAICTASCFKQDGMKENSNIYHTLWFNA